MKALNPVLVCMILFLIATRVNARKLPEWNFSSLLEASDLAAVVTMDVDTTVDDESNEFGKISLICHSTTFRIEAMLKGNETEKIRVRYYQYRTDGFLIGAVNGPTFPSFVREIKYLLFLKR